MQYIISSHTTQLSANQLISATSRDLQRLTQVVRRGNKQQKLQAERLTSDLREAVERYSLMQKVIKFLFIEIYLIIDITNYYLFYISKYLEISRLQFAK